MDLARIPLPTDLPCRSPARQWMARDFICPAAVPDCSPAASWNGACRSRWRRIPASKLWRSRASRRAPQATSSRCWPPARSGSAWLSVIAGNPCRQQTARAPRATPSPPSASGGPSSRRTSPCGPMPASRRHARRSAAASASATAGAHSSLGGKIPDQARFNQPMPEAVAAQPGRTFPRRTPGTCSDKADHLWSPCPRRAACTAFDCSTHDCRGCQVIPHGRNPAAAEFAQLIFNHDHGKVIRAWIEHQCQCQQTPRDE